MEKKTMCKGCEDRGYVEVVYDDGDFIEACFHCESILEKINHQTLAKEAAIKDGYLLSGMGKILGYRPKT